jgi:hypothetical protein
MVFLLSQGATDLYFISILHLRKTDAGLFIIPRGK